MEHKLIEQSIMPSQMCLDQVAQIPVECDLLLPDYCPDVMKVLKCTARPCIVSRTLVGDQLSIEGSVELCLYYADEARQLRRYEHRHSFSKVFDLGMAPEDAAVSVSCCIDYLDARATDPRRVQLRGMAVLTARVLAGAKQTCLCDVQGGSVQVCRQPLPFSRVVGSTRKQFTIRDQLDCSHAVRPIESILRLACEPTVTEQRIVAGKVVLQGELSLEALCADAEGATEVLAFTLPMSQLVDLDGVEEGCRCQLRLAVVSATLMPAGEEDGPTLTAEVTLAAEVMALCEQQLDVLTDAYSTAYETTCTWRAIETVRLLDTVDTGTVYEETVDMPADMQRIVHVWAQARYLGCEQGAGSVTVTGRLTICMLAFDGQDMPAYFERSGDVHLMHELAQVEQQMTADLQVHAARCSCEQLPGRKLRIRVDVRASGALYTSQSMQILSDLALDEQAPKRPDPDAALKIYYAAKGERIWDIAKHYNTCVAAVREENALSEDVLTGPRALLIPLIL